MRTPPSGPNHLPQPHLQIPFNQGLGFNIRIWGETETFSPLPPTPISEQLYSILSPQGTSRASYPIMLVISYPSWLTLITSKTARASHRSACLRSPPTGNMTQPGFRTMAGWPQSRSLSSKNPNVLQCPIQSPKSTNPTLPDRPLHSNGDIPTPIKWLIHFCFGFNYSAHPTMTFSSSRLT